MIREGCNEKGEEKGEKERERKRKSKHASKNNTKTTTRLTKNTNGGSFRKKFLKQKLFAYAVLGLLETKSSNQVFPKGPVVITN